MPEEMSDNKLELATETWRLFFGFFMTTRSARDKTLEEFKLTPVDAKALYSLSQGDGKAMGALAEEWSCDASNATWMVDRLERRGLAERQVSPTDRRVKLVTLTRKGAATRKKLLELLLEPPEELLALPERDLKRLRDALGILPPLKQPPGWMRPGPGP
jgi:DNA-binding MarR family transcriptional regulator